MSNLPAIPVPQAAIERWGEQQIEIIRQSIADGTSDAEFAYFLTVAARTGLDPFARQIYAVMRYNKAAGRKVMTIQTGIDGYREIADRSGQYVGSSRPTFGPMILGDGRHTFPEWAEISVTKAGPNGVGEFVGVAYWDEYYPGDGPEGTMWRKMPRTMLAKCAEAQALRRAFPSHIAGLYTHDEMNQADVDQDPWRGRRDGLIARARALPPEAKAALKANHPDPRTATPDELAEFERALTVAEDDQPADAELLPMEESTSTTSAGVTVDESGADTTASVSAPHPAIQHTLDAARFDKPLDVSSVPMTPQDIAAKAAYAIQQREKQASKRAVAAAVSAE